MMRGITYDDNYIARKMHSLDQMPSYGHQPPSYGYSQESGLLGDKENGFGDDLLDGPDKYTSSLSRPGLAPSSKTQLILNRVALSQPKGYSPSMRGYAPRMGPPPPPYYDYDYGYGGLGGYGSYGGYGGYRPLGCGLNYGYPPPPPPPRYRNYDPYLEEEYDMNYVPRYRPSRMSDALLEIEKERLRSVSPVKTTTTTVTKTTNPALPASDYMAKHFSPGMLQAQVDKMRNRLQAMSYSLDPAGPVPELEYHEKSRLDGPKKYSSALEMAELPRISTRRTHVYPEDNYMKDNLRIKCLSHYKTTRSAAEYWKPKLKYAESPTPALTLPTYKSKFGSGRAGDDSSKWEEPGTVYTRSSDIRPFSKTDEVEEDDQKKERRRKKKSKEREEALAIESSPKTDPTTPDSTGPVDAENAELDEKEKKRLEKKKRKAEREAAAKAAMEAELAALAEAEAELARLESESAGAKAPQELKTESSMTSCPEVQAAEAPQEPEPEVKPSEESADKCESSIVEPECLPTESENHPSILPSSDTPTTAEDNLQEHVGEHIESTEPEVEKVSAPVEEPSHQVTQEKDTTEIPENNTEITFDGSSDVRSKSPVPTYDSSNLPTYTTEACIWGDADTTSADALDEVPASTDECPQQPEGEAEPSGMRAEETLLDECDVQEQQTLQSVDQTEETPCQDSDEHNNQEPATQQDEEQQESINNIESTIDPVEDVKMEEIPQDQSSPDENNQIPESENYEDQQQAQCTKEPEFQQPDQTESQLEDSDTRENDSMFENEDPVNEEEPNLDDVPLETDVDIFAGRED